jgi:LAO/AO transport system kinase
VSQPLVDALLAGDRRALGRAITWAESTLPEDRERVEQLLAQLSPHTGGSHRVALTGPPGVGKSTLVDALGAAALAAGKRVAVLAIDPASAISGGSVLGDALRMPRLSASEQVFLRSSSNAGTLGGAAPGTRESVLLCEAAGFELVLIETVGVGQAEQAAADLCDTLVVLAQPGAGDEVQGMKRGLLERADAVVVTKADGASEQAARAHAAELSSAFALLRRRQPPYVAVVSAQSGLGVSALLSWLLEREGELEATGELEQRRRRQLVQAFHSALAQALLARVGERGHEAERLARAEAAVACGLELPTSAARRLVQELLGWPAKPL